METQRLSANGLSFAADIAGHGDTVALLLHGFPESRVAWRAQTEALTSLGWKTVAPDLRGYGDTDRPRGRAAYRIARLVEDVDALFEAAGARRRVLIGHDWGGIIAWQAALRGTPLDGLVILNAPHPAVFQREAATWEQRRRSWYVVFFMLPLLPELALARGGGEGVASVLRRQSPHISAEQLDVYRRNAAQPGAARAMVNYYRANALDLVRQTMPADPIGVPTLMVWGENDLALGLALTEGNEAYVSDFTLRRAPGASHWVQYDAPEVVNGAIAEWARAKRLAGA